MFLLRTHYFSLTFHHAMYLPSFAVAGLMSYIMLSNNILCSLYSASPKAEIVRLSTALDLLKKDLLLCSNRTLIALKLAKTRTERRLSFEEFTARLGEGQPPVPGLEDWRKYVLM